MEIREISVVVVVVVAGVLLDPGVVVVVDTTVFPFFFLLSEALAPAEGLLSVFPLAADEDVVVVVDVLLLRLAALVGTLGVLTGSMGELVRDREPKNRMGFSGDAAAVPEAPAFLALAASNLARPLATAPAR